MRAALALLLLSSGCVQILGLEEPSSGSPGVGFDGGINPFMDSGTGPLGDGGPGGGLCAPAPNFSPEIKYAVGANSRQFDVGDVNHDGFPDVAVANDMAIDSAHALLVLHGIGGQMLGAPQDVAITVQSSCMAGATNVAVGDVDGDGFYDLIAFACPTRVVVRRQNQSPSPPGQFLAEQSFQLAPTVKPAAFMASDLNDDGRDDLFLVSQDGSAQVFLARTDVAGAFTAGFTDSSGGSTPPDSKAVVEDLNGDGLVDLAWLTQNGLRYALQIPGMPGKFNPASVLGTSGDVAFAVGPVNADALNDVIMFQPPTGRIFLQNPTNHALLASGSFQSFIGHGSTQLLDLNGDGRADLGAEGQIVLQCGSPAAPGTFQSMDTPPINVLSTAQGARFVDITGEGKADALGLDPAGGLLSVRIHQ
jgi:FG-GAP-like repeat